MPLTITITTPSPVPNETLPSVLGETMLPSLSLKKTPPAPSVQNARQSAVRWRDGNQLAHISRGKTPTGTTFSFSLNEQATVSFSFTQILSRGAHGCLTKTHKNVKRNSCDNTVRGGTLSFTGHSGTNIVVFAGRISRTDKLKPGRYKLIITATNTTGQHSAPVSLSFTIVWRRGRSSTASSPSAANPKTEQRVARPALRAHHQPPAAPLPVRLPHRRDRRPHPRRSGAAADPSYDQLNGYEKPRLPGLFIDGSDGGRTLSVHRIGIRMPEGPHTLCTQ